MTVSLAETNCLDYLVIVFNIVVILFLVALNGFFVASEFSIVKVRPSRLDTLIKEGNKITIYVDTTSPEKVEGTNPRQMFTISIFSLIAGLAFLTVGILSVSGVINM